MLIYQSEGSQRTDPPVGNMIQVSFGGVGDEGAGKGVLAGLAVADPMRLDCSLSEKSNQKRFCEPFKRRGWRTACARTVRPWRNSISAYQGMILSHGAWY